MSKSKSVHLNSKTSLLKRLFFFVRPYKKKFLLSIFLSVLLAAMAPLRPFLIQSTINQGVADESTFFFTGPGTFIIEVTIFQILLLIIETSARFYFTFSAASLGQHVVKDLRDATYSKILRLNLSQFDKTPIGTLTTRTVNDIESVNDIFSDGLIPIVADLLSILSVLIYMFYTDWKITLVCLIPFPFLILATYFFKESVNKSFVKVRNSVASLNAFIQEHLSGMSVIQAFATEEREMNKFKKINNDHRHANIKAIFAYSVFFPVVELVSALSIGLLVWWAAHQSILMPHEESKNIAGVITSFILCINLLFRPLRMIADKFNVLQMGMIACERVFKVLDNEDVLAESESQNKPLEKNHILNGNIEFTKVWFAYNDKDYVLKGINFEIEAGKTIAIVGNTGSGKTTIVSLVNRLYQIQKGSIMIGGVDVKDIKIEELRSKIAVVLQDVFLFSGTVLDNMTLRNPNISRDLAIDAAKSIGLHDFIMQLPENYDFNVMERGSTLSTGQRQLLSFARALLYNPSILILDEATSSIDAESELLIQNAIDKVIKGRTSIIIAHRLSTIKKADKIIVLESGQIKEMGSHSELINKKGHYFELYQKQFSSDLV